MFIEKKKKNGKVGNENINFFLHKNNDLCEINYFYQKCLLFENLSLISWDSLFYAAIGNL